MPVRKLESGADQAGKAGMRLPRIFLIISLILIIASTSFYVGKVSAPSSPTIVRTGTGGPIGPCTWFVSMDGTTPVAEAMVGGLSVSPGDNVVATAGSDPAAFINARMLEDTPRLQQDRICLRGAFQITSPLKIPSYTLLDLSGSNITLANGANSDLIRSGNYPSFGNCDYVTILQGTINGNKANNVGFGSDTLLGCNHVLIDGTTILNIQGTGFLFERGTDIIVTNTRISGTGADGITCYDGSFNCRFVNNYITNVPTSSNGILLLGTEAGGQIASGNLEAISNQIVLTNTGQGISARSGADNSTISNNQISCATALCTNGSGSIGIYLFSQLGQAVTTRANVLGNVIRLGTGSTSTGISINDDGSSSTNKQVSVLQNLIEAHTGISVQGASSQITVAWNDVRNTVTGVATGASITNVFLGYNNGFTTINSGANTVADGGTINHGLASITPSLVTCTTTIANQVCAITAVGGVNFTVAIKVDSTGAAGTSQTIYWMAQYCPSPQFRCSP